MIGPDGCHMIPSAHRAHFKIAKRKTTACLLTNSNPRQHGLTGQDASNVRADCLYRVPELEVWTVTTEYSTSGHNTSEFTETTYLHNLQSHCQGTLLAEMPSGVLSVDAVVLIFYQSVRDLRAKERPSVRCNILQLA